MCGIAGWIEWNGDITRTQHFLENMATPLTCRGPDGSGTWVSPHAGLAHRRLVVIDPEGGMQPMSRREGDHVYTIVYNGEIYNFQELRTELRAMGFSFRSRSDTEVLLTAYIAWGPEAVSRLNGIFAFAIWESKDQTLFLARDRLGVKPLFYARRGPTFVFGSELKALLAHPAVEPEIDGEGLAEVFALGPSRTPGHGVFRDVFELRSGYYLLYNRKGIHERQYWSLTSHDHVDDLDTTKNTVRDLLQDAVERQIVADVPVVTLLSGGLDSSAVTGFAAHAFRRQGQGPLHTFSIDFVDMMKHFKANRFQTNLDAPWVEKVSQYFGTVHHAVVLDTPELSDYLIPAMRARDLPGHADIDPSLLLFAQEIKKSATVGLSGEAADEIFGGYPWFHHEDAIRSTTFPWARRIKDRLSVFSSEFMAKAHPLEYVDDRYHQALQEVPRLPGESPFEARIREIAYLSITRFLPTLLDRKDRMTMAASLEVRVPFCDHRLVDYVWNIPWHLKNYGQTAKGILREALKGWLPDDVLLRQKSPYPSTPNPSYFQAVSNRTLQILNDPTSPLLPLINASAIKELASAGPQAEQIPFFGQLMGNAGLFSFLVQADAWLREYRVRIL